MRNLRSLIRRVIQGSGVVQQLQEAGMPITHKIPFTPGPEGIKLITKDTLKKLCPQAAKALKGVDHDNTFWIITQRPELMSGSPENGDEVWSETNEPELAVWLAEEWDTIAASVGDARVVFLCGTADDEYGNFWSNTDQAWLNYSF